LLLTWISPVYVPGIFSSGINPVAASFGLAGDDKLNLVLYLLAIGLFNGFVEELGWTGFATPRLTKKASLWTGAPGLGIMWGLWHLIANYLGSATDAGTVPLPLYLAVMLFSFLLPFRILMVWVYRHTQSLLIAILMHASLDIFWMLSMPVSLTGEQRMVWYVTWATLLWGLVAYTRIRSTSNRGARA
jgi:membrane protease YdiL (CAAX protease family)